MRAASAATCSGTRWSTCTADPLAAGRGDELGGLLDRLRAVVLRALRAGRAARRVDRRAGLAQRDRDAAPGPARGARDERDLALQRPAGAHRRRIRSMKPVLGTPMLSSRRSPGPGVAEAVRHARRRGHVAARPGGQRLARDRELRRPLEHVERVAVVVVGVHVDALEVGAEAELDDLQVRPLAQDAVVARAAGDVLAAVRAERDAGARRAVAPSAAPEPVREQLPREADDEARVVAQIAPPQAAGLLREPEGPLQAEPLQPARAPGRRARRGSRTRPRRRSAPARAGAAACAPSTSPASARRCRPTRRPPPSGRSPRRRPPPPPRSAGGAAARCRRRCCSPGCARRRASDRRRRAPASRPP